MSNDPNQTSATPESSESVKETTESPVTETVEVETSQPDVEAKDQGAESATSDAQDSIGEATTSPVESTPVETAQAESTPTDSDQPGSNIRIGSQRDAADKSLTPTKPKAVRAAEENPLNVDENAEPAAPTVSLADVTKEWNDADADIDAAALDAMMGSTAVEVQEELETDSRIKGTVTRIHNENVFFRLKSQFVGVTPIKSFKKPPELGLMTDVIVKSYNPEDSLYEVAIPGAAITGADWSELEKGALIDVKVSGSNTGGLECMVNGIRGFIPASQIAIHRVENFGEYVGKKLTCVITEVKPKRKNLVLSHRAILEREQEEKKKEMMATLAVDQTFKGTVTRLMDFGAFVDIGSGVEGLVHVSKLSWDRVSHPKEVLEVGQAVEVKIEKINAETGKIGLTYRDLQEHPWHDIESKFEQDKTYKGVVSRVADFGAFVKLAPGIEGLVHVSELAHYRVQTVRSVVTEGKDVEVKVLSIDKEKQKISLSMKALLPEPEKKDKKVDEGSEDEPIRPSAVKKRNKPLRGGTSGRSDGDKFGLKW